MDQLTCGLYDLVESGVAVVRPGMDARAQAETAIPLSLRPYDGTPMGTLPAQRGRGNAGFGIQEGGSRWDRASANEARLDRNLSISVYRRPRDRNGSEEWAGENGDCTESWSGS